MAGFTGNEFFLSNMYPCVVRFEKRIYRCSEAAFQAQKCANEKDMEAFTKMDGYEAKKHGREVELRKDWDSVKDMYMKRILLCKFYQNPMLAQKLINYQQNPICERNNHHDNEWGNCVCMNADGKHPQCLRQGANKLGRMLMEVRSDPRIRATTGLVGE